MMMTELPIVALCGVVAVIGACLLKYHSEARYRFCAASMMLGSWLATAGIAVEAISAQQSPRQQTEYVVHVASK